MDSRNMEIYLSGSTVRSSAYICLAVILAVFMVTFAVAPKARTQDSSHHFVSANHYSTWKQAGTDVSDCNTKETKGEPVTDDRFPTLCLGPPSIGT
jgi:hypothetical protein